MNSVGIFRLQLFKASEVFITQQAQSLTRYRPIYIGHKRFGDAPAGADVVSLDDARPTARWKARLSRSTDALVSGLDGARLSLIHAHFAIDGVYALPLAQRLNIPLAVTLHGFDVTISDKALLTARSPAWINYYRFRQTLKRRADLFLCVSNYIRDQAIEQGFPENRLIVHYLGTKLPDMTADVKSKSPVIAHVARLVEKKGTIFLLRACSDLANRGIPFTLLVIGEGPQRGQLEAEAARLGITDNCKFVGAKPHSEVLDLLRRSTVLALPSVTAYSGDAEGLGMVLLEASSLGVPVVGSDNGGIPEAIIEGGTGFVVPQRDSTALGRRLEDIIRSPDLAAEFGQNGRRFVLDTFDVVKQNEKLERIWDRLEVSGHQTNSK